MFGIYLLKNTKDIPYFVISRVWHQRMLNLSDMFNDRDQFNFGTANENSRADIEFNIDISSF